MDTVTLKGSARTPDSKRNYPSNCWWVAASTGEVTRTPLSRWLLERPVVLFRTEDGDVTALEDRCAHRWAPLSHGRVIGDEIACPYHGFRYNTRGACTHVPTQLHVPTELKIRSYPACEHGPFVWIWMDDPTRADPALLPRISWSADATYIQSSGYMQVNCKYTAIHENLIDTAHADYLHSPVDRDWRQPTYTLAPSDVQVTDRSVTILQEFNDMPFELKSIESNLIKRVKMLGMATFAAPGCHLQQLEIEDSSSETLEHYNFRGIHCTTPISLNRCHWWWTCVQDFGRDIAQDVQKRWEVILRQDKDVLEAIQMTVEQDIRGDNVPKVLVVADRAMAEVRRIVQKMLEAEST